MLELITENEYRMMDDYRKEYAAYSYKENLNLENFVSSKILLQEWSYAKQKNYLNKLFGDKLILEKEIEYVKPFEDLKAEMVSHFSLGWKAEQEDYSDEESLSPAKRFLRQYHLLFQKLGKELSDKGQLGWMEDNYYYSAQYLMGAYNLAKNVYEGRSFKIPCPDGKDLAINEGCKISKILGKIAEKFNLPFYEDFRIEHSQILNTKTLKGILCLSIHPLDYMTMSDNACDWTSCMSWMERGCYRQGTVEMMNSPMVVVGYLKSPSPLKLSIEDEWSNKKWRCLYIVNENLIASVKSYPYTLDTLNYEILKWLKQLTEQRWGAKYENDCYVSEIDLTGDRTRLEDKYYYFDATTCYMYNDCGTCTHYGYINKNAETEISIEICYSGTAQCMICGDTDVDIEGDDEGKLTCEKCEDIIVCGSCYGYVRRGFNYEIDDTSICENCKDDSIKTDIFTGEQHLSNNMHKIYLDLCEYYTVGTYFFYESKTLEDMWKYCKKCEHHWSDNYIITLKDLKPEGFETFLNIPKDDIKAQKEFVENKKQKYIQTMRNGRNMWEASDLIKQVEEMYKPFFDDLEPAIESAIPKPVNSSLFNKFIEVDEIAIW